MAVLNFTDAFVAGTPPAQGASGTFAMAAQTIPVAGGVLALNYGAGQQVFATLTANVTSVTLTGMPDTGAIMELVLTQDATGGRTVTWPAGWLAAGGFKPDIPPYPNSVSRILLTSIGGGRILIDFAGLDYR